MVLQSAEAFFQLDLRARLEGRYSATLLLPNTGEIEK